jgi:hypothetical protein
VWQRIAHAKEFEGCVDGTLVFPPRGAKGFGYDPIFLPDGHDRTFGEMMSAEKHAIPADASRAVAWRPRFSADGAGVFERLNEDREKNSSAIVFRDQARGSAKAKGVQ